MLPYILQLYGSWIQGLTWIAVLLLTLWPTRRGLTIASLLWLIGSLAAAGVSGYSLFVGVAMGLAFSSRPFPVTAWLLPLVSLGLVFAEAALLRPSLRPDSAMRIGRVLLLVVGPALHVLPYVEPFLRGIPEFPLDAGWLAPVLLWFRIRELQSTMHRRNPEGPEPLTAGVVSPQ